MSFQNIDVEYLLQKAKLQTDFPNGSIKLIAVDDVPVKTKEKK